MHQKHQLTFKCQIFSNNFRLRSTLPELYLDSCRFFTAAGGAADTHPPLVASQVQDAVGHCCCVGNFDRHVANANIKVTTTAAAAIWSCLVPRRSSPISAGGRDRQQRQGELPDARAALESHDAIWQNVLHIFGESLTGSDYILGKIYVQMAILKLFEI